MAIAGDSPLRTTGRRGLAEEVVELVSIQDALDPAFEVWLRCCLDAGGHVEGHVEGHVAEAQAGLHQEHGGERGPLALQRPQARRSLVEERARLGTRSALQNLEQRLAHGLGLRRPQCLARERRPGQVGDDQAPATAGTTAPRRRAARLAGR